MLSLVGVALWIAAPVASVTVLTLVSDRTRVETPVTVWAPVEANHGTVRSDVQLVLSWSSSVPIVAPAWNGVVQRVLIGEGDVVESGTAIALVDGITRRAFATDVPFVRPLSLDDRGPEVAQLNAFLAAQVGAPLSGDRFTWSTRVATERFAESIGVPAGARSSFDPGWLVFLPSPRLEASVIDLVLGAPAPAQGAVIIEPAPRLSAALLVAKSGDGATPTTDDDAQASDPAVGLAVTAESGQSLFVGATELALPDTRDRVADESLSTLQELVEDEASAIQAALRAGAQSGQFRLPSSAVFSTSTQPSCVVVRRDAETMAVPVVVVGDALGEVIVTGPLRRGDSAALSPPAELRRCA